MDLSNLKVSEDAVEMKLYHPVSGEKLDMTIKVIGQDSQEYKDSARSILKMALKKAPKNDLSRLNSDDDEEYSSKLKAAHIKGWANYESNGKPVKYSKSEAVKLIKDFPWIREQIEEFVEDRANFIKG